MHNLSLYWGIPFSGILLSLAILPLLIPTLWHKHFGKIIGGWTLGFLIPFFCTFQKDTTFHLLLHTLLLDYIPFVALIAALYVVTGGIRLKSQWLGTPLGNLGILGAGALLASWIGTTGASMLLIRPLIRANAWRRHTIHIFIFFIFLVSNIGGALTPLGDPPLFLGFLQGVPFFWPTLHLLPFTILLIGGLLGIFYAVDVVLYKKEEFRSPFEGLPKEKLTIEGKGNFLLLGLILGAVLLSGIWHPSINIICCGLQLPLENTVRDLSMVAIILLSLKFTPPDIRLQNHFSWDPLVEVSKVFLGIFITVAPVIIILQAREAGALGSLVAQVNHQGLPHNASYFWLTGLFSSFLDNAPTYLVFFYMAGGDVVSLTGPLKQTLMAISQGAVFMGAMSYIGNAPNFMVRSVVEQHGIKMPSFFGYMMWSCGILLPLFILLSWGFF